jgi:plastocyanin
MFSNLKTRAIFPQLCILAIALLVLLSTCGSNSSSSSSASASLATTVSNTPSATSSGNDYGGWYGNYGNSSGTTPTATTAVTGSTQTVTMKLLNSEFAFSPASLTISMGTTVIWNNTTGAPHTVTSDDGKTFDSGIKNPVQPDRVKQPFIVKIQAMIVGQGEDIDLGGLEDGHIFGI